MRGNKGFILLFLFLAIASLLLILVFRPGVTDKWDAMTKNINRMKMEAKTRTLPHSPFREKLTPGNAWDEYNIALKDAQTWNDDANGTVFIHFANGTGRFDRAKVEKIVAGHAGALEHLHLGAQRSDGQYPYNWDSGFAMSLPSLYACRKLANLSVAQSKILMDSGRAQEAASLLIDLTVFARDLATNGPLLSNLIGLAMYTIAFDEMRHLLLSGKLTPQQLADFEKKLEIVDRDFPSVHTGLSAENLTFNITLAEMAEGGARAEFWQLIKAGEWSLLMSPKPTILRALEEKNSYVERSEKLDSMNFADARKEADAISAAASASTSALVRMAAPSMNRMVVVHREALAHLRLLRAGTTYLATGKLPQLADPFGEKLFFNAVKEKPVIWSIGKDGSNQNGRGNWDPGMPDMVLEIVSPTAQGK